MKINWPESELTISLGSFCTHVPPPPLKNLSVCVGGRIGAPDDLSDVNANFKTFKTLQTIRYPPSYRFDKVAPKYVRNRTGERKRRL